jgi:hypothetical protein
MFLQHAAILPCKDYKRSEFDYADFYYQRYLLNLPNYFQPFKWEALHVASLVSNFLVRN